MLLRIIFVALTVAGSCAATPPDTSAGLIASGQELLQKQQWPAAISEFQRAVNVSPGDALAHFGLALAWRGAGDAARAISEVNTALKLQPSFDDAQMLLGLLLQQTGDATAAIAQYRLVLKRNPKSAEAHNWLGVAYMQTSALPEAIAEFRAAVALNPKLVRAWNNLGSTLSQGGDITEGITAFREGLKHAPDDLQLRFNLGTALRTSGDSEGAIAELQTVLKRDPNNPELHYQLGLAFREQGDVEAAASEMETALALNPEYREGYYALGQTLKQMSATKRAKSVPVSTPSLDQGLALAQRGDLPGAIEQFRKAAALTPNSAEVQFHLGAALWYSGDRTAAAEALDAAIRYDPAAGPAYSLRGLAYRESGDAAAAQRMVQRAIALNPNAPIGYFDLGVAFLRRKELIAALGQFEAGLNLPSPGGAPADLNVAIRELRAAISVQPGAEAYQVLGRMLGYVGADAREVVAAFESALRIKPDFAEARNHLGLVQMQAGDDAKAVAAFREAIRLRPDYADAHANLGAILTATDAAESVKELERAVELQPGLLKARYNLAIAYGSSPKHGVDREIVELRKLIAVQADYPRAEFSLGKALLRKGSLPDGVDHLERAVKAEPGFGEAQYQLGLALSRAGRPEEAAKWLKQGRELIAEAQRDQTVMLDLSEGRAALQNGETAQAVAKFRSAVRQRPDLAEAHYQLGVALQRQRDNDAAVESLRNALRLNPAHEAARASLGRMPGKDADPMARFEGYIREGRFAEVQPLLETYLKENPKSARAWYVLGYSLFTQKKVGESISALAKSLSLDVTNAEAHKVLGRSLMLIGRFDAARREFELGEKYSPKSAEMPFNLGRLFSIQDQWAEAKAAFERALQIEPNYVEAWDGLGFAQEALGDDAGALASYRKAAKRNEERNGDFATPYVNLSAFYNRGGDADAALDAARKAVAINDKADRGWFQMARAHERKGELDAAVGALKRAVAINSRVSSYYYVLATIYRRLGNEQESREAIETFSKLDRETNEIERKRREGLRAEAPRNE